MKKTLLLFSFALLFSIQSFAQGQFNIIPMPARIEPQKGVFKLSAKTMIFAPDADASLQMLITNAVNQLNSTSKLEIQTFWKGKELDNMIVFKENNSLGDEAYSLNISPLKIVINYKSTRGGLYALQTLLQILPLELLTPSAKNIPTQVWDIPTVIIEDKPRFGYRGIMLDAARHFFPVTDIKRFIDIMSLYKFNTLHWHLTDDQGWRIEIKKYPRLTEIGSIRKTSMLGHYRDQKFDGKPHGGFYSQDEIKDLIRYAAAKQITVVPEIEMPGHAVAALAAYPEFGCNTDKIYEVASLWGVHDDVFCPRESTFKFLEDVLTEVMALFPSKYIHIGGDECPKTQWKQSKFCQDLMRKEGLKDEHELQSYFIKRIDKFVSSKGKSIIGWDEILEGGLSPNATVMSWRGVEGGIAAAKQNHDVIMSPTTFNYLDYYQAEPATEPLAIGGFLPIEKTYSFEPVSDELSAEQATKIIGVQANVWTEYIDNEAYLEYMTYPRAIAVAEVAWSGKGMKNWTDFAYRLRQHFKRLELAKINFSPRFLDVKATPSTANNKMMITLSSLDSSAEIRYTTDGTEPNANATQAFAGIVLDKNTILKANIFRKGKAVGKTLTKSYLINKATGHTYSLVNQPKGYTGGDTYGLTNGIKGTLAEMAGWVGFSGKDLETVLDLGQVLDINTLTTNFNQTPWAWILHPKTLEVSISIDGQTFTDKQMATRSTNDVSTSTIETRKLNFGGKKARYVKIKAENYGKIPVGNAGEGQDAWLFCDEIEIE